MRLSVAGQPQIVYSLGGAELRTPAFMARGTGFASCRLRTQSRQRLAACKEELSRPPARPLCPARSSLYGSRRMSAVGRAPFAASRIRYRYAPQAVNHLLGGGCRLEWAETKEINVRVSPRLSHCPRGKPASIGLAMPSRSVLPVFLGAALVGWCQTMNMGVRAGVEPASRRRSPSRA